MDRRLAAIVATDVVGYSRLMAEDEAGTLSRLNALREQIFNPKAAEYKGRVVKLMGDGALLEFGSVVDAVNFAVDVQQRVLETSTIVSDSPQITFRIGVNIGDVILEGDDIYGDGVNVAARLEALADPGGVCVSGGVYDQVKGKVAFGFEDLGLREVKNIPEPVRTYKVAGKVGTDKAAPTKAASRLPFFAGIAALCLVLLAATVWWRPWMSTIAPASEARMAFPLPDRPSIAVMPFQDLSEGGRQEYFADGITEDLITDLSKISGLFVIARNSSFAYKNAPASVSEVAESLGVKFVLKGSVRRAGDTLRVNAQLIDATTGGHIWADRFDGDVNDVFAVQDKFVLLIVNALDLKLSSAEEIEITKDNTTQIAAKELFQRGWDLFSRFNEEDNARSADYFEKAIELDPDYGQAYGALALVTVRGSTFGWSKAMGRQEEDLYHNVAPLYLEKASGYGTALVHVAKAMRHLYYRHGAEPEGPNRGTDDARREAGLAIALQPSDPEAHVTMAWALIAAGRPEEGLNFVRAAMRLNPTYPNHYAFFLAAAYYGMGDLEQAADVLRDSLKRDPKAVTLAPLAASIFVQTGKREEAAAAIKLWRPRDSEEQINEAIQQHRFPIRWVDNDVNNRLWDGLRLAALPLEVTVATLRSDLTRLIWSEKYAPIQTLGWFGPAAAPAVPELIEALNSENRLVRKGAAIALGKIGPDAKDAIPHLKALTDVPLIGFHAKEALVRIGG